MFGAVLRLLCVVGRTCIRRMVSFLEPGPPLRPGSTLLCCVCWAICRSLSLPPPPPPRSPPTLRWPLRKQGETPPLFCIYLYIFLHFSYFIFIYLFLFFYCFYFLLFYFIYLFIYLIFFFGGGGEQVQEGGRVKALDGRLPERSTHPLWLYKLPRPIYR